MLRDDEMDGRRDETDDIRARMGSFGGGIRIAAARSLGAASGLSAPGAANCSWMDGRRFRLWLEPRADDELLTLSRRPRGDGGGRNTLPLGEGAPENEGRRTRSVSAV